VSGRGTPDVHRHGISAELESKFSRVVVLSHSLAQHDLESLKHSRSHDGCSRSSAVTEVSVGISTVSQSHTGAVATPPVGAKARSPDALLHRANAALTHIASEVTADRLAWCQGAAPQMSSGRTSVLRLSPQSTVGHTVAAIHWQPRHTGLHRLLPTRGRVLGAVARFLRLVWQHAVH
jgi:hypothetical protein